MLIDSINPILQWLNTHPNLSGLATFIISATESIAIIGTIIPGTIMMTAIGTLVGAGVIPFCPTLIWAILGAAAGDGISYWVGHYFKNRLHVIWPFRQYPNLLESGEKFFHRHGGMSVFIGRFVGPVRALVPLVAGMLNMKPLKFMFANITSAIGWAPVYMFPGILLGAVSLELPPDIAVHMILMLLLLALFISLCVWLLRKIFILISQKINNTLTLIWGKLQESRFFSPITTLLKHYDPHQSHGQLILAFYFILTGSVLLYLMLYLFLHPPASITVNNIFFHFFRSMRTPTGDNIMLYITMLGYKEVLLPLGAVLFAWLLWTKHFRTAWHALALCVLTAGSIFILKIITHTDRPWGIVNNTETFSFPSGHTTLSTTVYIALALLFVKIFKIKRAWPIFVLVGMVIFAVGISRLYLGAHWLTDIIGSWLLGATVLMFIVLSYHRVAEKDIKPTGVLIISIITLCISYGLFAERNFNQLKHNTTQLDWPNYSLNINAWWDQQGEHLPLYRINRFGFANQVLNLQWAGDLSTIKAILLNNGWQMPKKRDWISVLLRVADVESAQHLPLVAPLYLDKNPVLVLVKPVNNQKKLMVLRLWDSNIIMQNKQPLWVGAIETAPRTYSWLFRHKKSNDLSIMPTLLFANTPTQYEIKQIPVANKTIVLIKPIKPELGHD